MKNTNWNQKKLSESYKMFGDPEVNSENSWTTNKNEIVVGV